MAKKKSKSAKQDDQPPSGAQVVQAVVAGGISSSDHPDEATIDDAEEMELLQVDLGDMVKMKQVLDEGVSSALLDHVPEDYHWDNIKLLLMFVSCVFAVTAQFAPLPFPESRPVLGICGSLYFILSGILQFITTFIDKDMIMQTNPLPAEESKGNSNNKKINPLLYKYGLRVRSNFPRFSEFYTVILEFRVPPNDPAYGSVEQKSVKQVWSVGMFFDKEGYFDEIGLSHEVARLYKRLEAENYNGTEEVVPLKTKSE